MHQFLKFTSFWNNTLHVSDGVSVHHQEFKTVHTATVTCQTDTVACLLSGTRWNESSILFPLASRQQVFLSIIRSSRLRRATGTCQTDTVACLLLGMRWNESSISFPLASRQQYPFDMYLLLYVQS